MSVEIKELVPIPTLTKRMALLALAEIYNIDDDDINLYLEQELAVIDKENPVVAALLRYNKKQAQEMNGEKAGQTSLIAGITVYVALKNQATFSYNKFCLQVKQAERLRKKT